MATFCPCTQLLPLNCCTGGKTLLPGVLSAHCKLYHLPLHLQPEGDILGKHTCPLLKPASRITRWLEAGACAHVPLPTQQEHVCATKSVGALSCAYGAAVHGSVLSITHSSSACSGQYTGVLTECLSLLTNSWSAFLHASDVSADSQLHDAVYWASMSCSCACGKKAAAKSTEINYATCLSTSGIPLQYAA